MISNVNVKTNAIYNSQDMEETRYPSEDEWLKKCGTYIWWNILLLYNYWVVSDSLQALGMQHSRLPCHSLSPRVCSKPCPLCQWCYCTILSSAALFSFCLLSFIASGSFQMSRSSHQMIKVLELQLSISPSMNIQSWFPLGLTDLISLQSKGLTRVFSNTTAPILQGSAFFIVQLSHLSMTSGKTVVLTIWTFVGKVMSLLLNMLSKFVIAFLPRSKYLLITWLQSPLAVTLEPKEIKYVTASTFSPSICHKEMGQDAMILFLLMLNLFYYCIIFYCAGSLLLCAGFLWLQCMDISLLWLLCCSMQTLEHMAFSSCGTQD